jgi:hypothetical protein
VPSLDHNRLENVIWKTPTNYIILYVVSVFFWSWYDGLLQAIFLDLAYGLHVKGEGWQGVVSGTVGVRERRREGDSLQLRYCYNQHTLQSMPQWIEPYPLCVLLRIARTKNMDSSKEEYPVVQHLCKSCNTSCQTNSYFPFAKLLRPVQTFQ